MRSFWEMMLGQWLAAQSTASFGADADLPGSLGDGWGMDRGIAMCRASAAVGRAGRPCKAGNLPDPVAAIVESQSDLGIG